MTIQPSRIVPDLEQATTRGRDAPQPCPRVATQPASL